MGFAAKPDLLARFPQGEGTPPENEYRALVDRVTPRRSRIREDPPRGQRPCGRAVSVGSPLKRRRIGTFRSKTVHGWCGLRICCLEAQHASGDERG